MVSAKKSRRPTLDPYHGRLGCRYSVGRFVIISLMYRSVILSFSLSCPQLPVILLKMHQKCLKLLLYRCHFIQYPADFIAKNSHAEKVPLPPVNYGNIRRGVVRFYHRKMLFCHWRRKNSS